MIASILMIGIFFSAFCVVFAGWGAKNALHKLGILWSVGATPSLLTCFALGVHVSALSFIAGWAFGNPDHPTRIAIEIIVLHLLIGSAGFFVRDPYEISERIHKPLVLMLLIGFFAGVYALIQFPNVLDSITVFQTQQFLLKLNGGFVTAPGFLGQLHALLLGGIAIPAQPGFGGLLFVPSLLMTNLPVVTVAAGIKPLLLMLAAVVALYAAAQFRFRPVMLSALLIFVTFIISDFGLYGLLQYGKDSIFGVLMAVAAIASMHPDDDDIYVHEPAIYMSAAILLGAVSIPFLMVFWAIYFIASWGRTGEQALRQALWCFYPLTIVVLGVHELFAAPGKSMVGPLIPLIVEGAVLMVASSVLRRFDAEKIVTPRKIRIALAFAPAICIFGVMLMMPAIAHVVTYENNAAVVLIHAPLDGLTDALDYAWPVHAINNGWLISFAVLICAVLPLASPKHRTPFYLALFTFLPAIPFVGLLHLHLHLHILPDFNIWDMTRDTVQWWVGAFSGIIVLVGMQAAMSAFSEKSRKAAFVAASLVFLAGLSQNYANFLWLPSQPLTMTSSGGFYDKATAQAMDYLWRNARGQQLYVTSGSQLDGFYPFYQMYTGTRAAHFVDGALIERPGKTVFFADEKDAMRIYDFAKSKHASTSVQGLGGDSFILSVSYDGFNGDSFDNVGSIAVSAISGAYATESAGATGLKWMSQDVHIRANEMFFPSGQYCGTLGFVNGWGDAGLQITVMTPSGSKVIPIPADASVQKPTVTHVCVPMLNGQADIELKANRLAQKFPNDSRSVSFGMIWPPSS